MGQDWVIVIFDGRSTVDTSAEGGGAIDLLSDGDLLGDGVDVCG